MHVWLYNISFSIEALWYKNIANLYMITLKYLKVL